MNGEAWAGFVEGGERGKRFFLREQAKDGVWADHIMILATACAEKVMIRIFSKRGQTQIKPEGEDGLKEVVLGHITEAHYFGAEWKENAQEQGRRGIEQEEQIQKRAEEGAGSGESMVEQVGGPEDSAVFNLGVDGLTEEMEDLLSLGLKFVPVQKINKNKLEADVDRLRVRVMWNAYWSW